MPNHPLKNLTKALNDPKVLDYCRRMYHSFTTVKPPKSYDKLYASFGLTINFDIRVTIQSKITYERHIIDLRSSIYTDFATDTPSPVNPYNNTAFERLSEKQINYVAEAVQQTVDAFVKAVTIAQI